MVCSLGSSVVGVGWHSNKRQQWQKATARKWQSGVENPVVISSRLLLSTKPFSRTRQVADTISSLCARLSDGLENNRTRNDPVLVCVLTPMTLLIVNLTVRSAIFPPKARPTNPQSFSVSVFFENKVGERRTENGERRTENGERRTENRERRTENGERRTENGERRTENGERRTEKDWGFEQTPFENIGAIWLAENPHFFSVSVSEKTLTTPNIHDDEKHRFWAK